MGDLTETVLDASGQAQEKPAFCKMCGHQFPNTRTYVTQTNSSCHHCGVPYNGGNTVVMCGCGRHMVGINDEKTCLYKNGWWALRCLFYKVDKRMPRLLRKFEEMEKVAEAYKKMRLKFIRMKNYMKKLPCANCGHEVGNRFVQSDDGLFCGTCGHLVDWSSL